VEPWGLKLEKNGKVMEIVDLIIPIGSMYGIYANIWGTLMGSMLPYIAAPWILWDSSSAFF